MREVAKEAGVSPATAERRLKLARDLEPYPETAAKVDRGAPATDPVRVQYHPNGRRPYSPAPYLSHSTIPRRYAVTGVAFIQALSCKRGRGGLTYE
jgi:hypothetical protein